jgi:hypothetical protein
MAAFGDGLADLFAGRSTLDAEAASMNLAEILILSGDSMTGGKFRGGG